MDNHTHKHDVNIVDYNTHQLVFSLENVGGSIGEISSKRILRLRRFVGVDPEFLPTSRSATRGLTKFGITGFGDYRSSVEILLKVKQVFYPKRKKIKRILDR